MRIEVVAWMLWFLCWDEEVWGFPACEAWWFTSRFSRVNRTEIWFLALPVVFDWAAEFLQQQTSGLIYKPKLQMIIPYASLTSVNATLFPTTKQFITPYKFWSTLTCFSPPPPGFICIFWLLSKRLIKKCSFFVLQRPAFCLGALVLARCSACDRFCMFHGRFIIDKVFQSTAPPGSQLRRETQPRYK